jgi:hypothetical protein
MHGQSEASQEVTYMLATLGNGPHMSWVTHSLDFLYYVLSFIVLTKYMNLGAVPSVYPVGFVSKVLVSNRASLGGGGNLRGGA